MNGAAALPDNVVSLDRIRSGLEDRRRTVAEISLRENRKGGIDFRIDAVDAANALPMLKALMALSARLMEIYGG
jgi:hypothetical protein